MSDLVGRLRKGCSCGLCRTDRWRGRATMDEAADLIETLTRQLAVAREALETIAQNDEYPVDADGEPMPIRPQWSSHQCSTIARQALARITSKEEHHG